MSILTASGQKKNTVTNGFVLTLVPIEDKAKQIQNVVSDKNH